VTSRRRTVNTGATRFAPETSCLLRSSNRVPEPSRHDVAIRSASSIVSGPHLPRSWRTLPLPALVPSRRGAAIQNYHPVHNSQHHVVLREDGVVLIEYHVDKVVYGLAFFFAGVDFSRLRRPHRRVRRLVLRVRRRPPRSARLRSVRRRHTSPIRRRSPRRRRLQNARRRPRPRQRDSYKPKTTWCWVSWTS
jgi:hypothetical protein